MQCPKCNYKHMYRVAREGFLQTRIFPLFGYYPWECPECRVPALLKGRGEKKHKLTPQHNSR